MAAVIIARWDTEPLQKHRHWWIMGSYNNAIGYYATGNNPGAGNTVLGLTLWGRTRLIADRITSRWGLIDDAGVGFVEYFDRNIVGGGYSRRGQATG